MYRSSGIQQAESYAWLSVTFQIPAVQIRAWFYAMITVSKVITHVALVQKWVNDLLTRPLSEGVVGRSLTRARAEGGSRERAARSDPVIILMTPTSCHYTHVSDSGIRRMPTQRPVPPTAPATNPSHHDPPDGDTHPHGYGSRCR